jgi:hypothetical protein
MESSYFINLVFIFAVNVFFFFSGIFLNSLIILSFWRSIQLRKKLCYFMIMVLFCCDLLTVLTNNSLMAFIAMSWLTGKLEVNIRSMGLYFLKINTYYSWFFIIRSFGDEFRSIFGDILSYLSSNIGNEGKTFNSVCNTDHRPNNFESDVHERLYFLPSAYSNCFYSFHSCDVIYQLQTVSSRQEKS